MQINLNFTGVTEISDMDDAFIAGYCIGSICGMMLSAIIGAAGYYIGRGFESRQKIKHDDLED